LTSVVVLDTDFLSAFLKIDQMSLIRDFYPAARVLVPPAVYREVSLTNLVPRLAGLDWLGMEIPEEARLDRLLQDHAFHRLGSGEQEAIALAAQFEASVLLLASCPAWRIVRGLRNWCDLSRKRITTDFAPTCSIYSSVTVRVSP
jgi:predicted nucleic acid-binding protein